MVGLIGRAIGALAVLGSTACSLPMVLEKNLAAIQASTGAITANNEIVKRSTSVTEAGIKSFEGLKGPMEAVAGLNPTLESVAALDQPMMKVAGLGPSMEEVAGLQKPMTRLVDIQPSLDATAALGPSMDRLAQMRPSLDSVASLRDPMIAVASLQPQLGAVANLKRSMDDLTALRQPLERAADLRDPLMQVAALGAVINQPAVFVAAALVGLVLWGAVTFLAVRLAIVSAATAQARKA